MTDPFIPEPKSAESKTARERGIDQMDRTDAQGLIPARPQADDGDSAKEALEKPLGEAKEGPVDGVSHLNTSGAAKGHW